MGVKYIKSTVVGSWQLQKDINHGSFATSAPFPKNEDGDIQSYRLDNLPNVCLYIKLFFPWYCPNRLLLVLAVRVL